MPFLKIRSTMHRNQKMQIFPPLKSMTEKRLCVFRTSNGAMREFCWSFRFGALRNCMIVPQPARPVMPNALPSCRRFELSQIKTTSAFKVPLPCGGGRAAGKWVRPGSRGRLTAGVRVLRPVCSNQQDQAAWSAKPAKPSSPVDWPAGGRQSSVSRIRACLSPRLHISIAM